MITILVVVSTSFAQRVIYIKITPETQAKIANIEAKNSLKDKFTVTSEPSISNKVKQWQKNGFNRDEFWSVFSTLLDKPESIGATFSKVADMLIKHTEAVSNTNIGKLAIMMFVWKLAGPSLVIYLIKIILLIWTIWFGVWWWKRNHTQYSLPLKTSVVKSLNWKGLIPWWRHDTIEKYIVKPSKEKYISGDDDYPWSVALHIAFFVIMTIIILTI